MNSAPRIERIRVEWFVRVVNRVHDAFMVYFDTEHELNGIHGGLQSHVDADKPRSDWFVILSIALGSGLGFCQHPRNRSFWNKSIHISLVQTVKWTTITR